MILTQFIALFGAGVASFLAPCIVPLVPAYLGIIVGEAGDTRDLRRLVPATCIFILGFATVFAGLGAAAGALGSALPTYQTAIRIGGGALIILMGAALLGIVRGPFARTRRPIAIPLRQSWWRPYVVGLAFGAGWSPCVGPLLAAALTLAARSGAIGHGALLLAAYALGIGVPFLLAALLLAGSPRIGARVQRYGAILEKVAGITLLILGVLLVTGTYSHLTSYLAHFIPTVHGL